MLDYFKKKLTELLDSLLNPFWLRLLAASWWMRLGAVGIAVGIIASITFWSMLQPWVELAMYLPRVEFGTAGRLHLHDMSRQRETVERLSVIVAADLHARDPKPSVWTAAENVWVLANFVGPTREFDLARYARAQAKQPCACWPELPDRPGDPASVFISGFVLAAMASQATKASAAEIGFLLQQQHAQGSWPMFEGVKTLEYASTYTTAWALIGLHAQHQLADTAEQALIDAAIDRGRAWLLRVREPGARWRAYPALAGSTVSGSISGMVLHALHLLGTTSLATLDDEWLQNLPPVPEASAVEHAYVVTQTPLGEIHDNSEQVILPWTLAATVDAYENGGLISRARALRWIDHAVSDPGVIAGDRQKDSWTRAELLYGLQFSLK
jgi:hypothetical protein